MSEKAIFKNGYPQNLPAAALDSLEWLEWLERAISSGKIANNPPDTLSRLRRAVSFLSGFVGECLPEVYEPVEEVAR